MSNPISNAKQAKAIVGNILTGKCGLDGVIHQINSIGVAREDIQLQNLAHAAQGILKPWGEMIENLEDYLASIPDKIEVDVKQGKDELNESSEKINSLNELKQTGSSTGNGVDDKLYLNLERLISICDLGSSDIELDSIPPARLGSLFYLCLDLALECKECLDELTGIKEVA